MTWLNDDDSQDQATDYDLDAIDDEEFTQRLEQLLERLCELLELLIKRNLNIIETGAIPK